MALKKSQLYSSLWQSCDELRGGMDASQYKDYILTLLFMKYVSDKSVGDPNFLIDVPEGGSFADIAKLKGDKEIGDKINVVIGKLAEANDLKGVNDFLDRLCAGTQPAPSTEVSVLDHPPIQPVGGIAGEDEQRLLAEINEWVVAQGLPEGDLSLELLDEADGQVVGYLDLAWPNGLQEGLSQPVALLIDEGPETEEAANKAGFRFFTDVDSFRSYVEREVLAVANAEVVGA